MRQLLLAAALVMLAVPSFAQPAQKAMMVDAGQLVQLDTRAKATRDASASARPLVTVPIITAGSYVLNLEHHVGKAPASLHPIWAELAIVLKGTGTITTGGTMIDGVTSADGNVHGPDMAGGTAQHVVPGDLMIIPEGVVHMLVSDADAPFVVATLHLPRSGAPGTGNGSVPSKLIHRDVDLSAMIARSKKVLSDKAHIVPGDSLLSLPPYRVDMEYHSSKGAASVDKNNGEFMYVLEGEGTLVTGGTMVRPRDGSADIGSDDIQGGNEVGMKKGDFIYVPKNMPRQARTDSVLVLATLQVPDL